MIFLREKLSKLHIFSFILAGIGVIYLTFDYGTFPWVSFVLAITFALYGLLKKVANVSAVFCLAIETLIVTPLALVYMLFVFGVNMCFGRTTICETLLRFFSAVGVVVPL